MNVKVYPHEIELETTEVNAGEYNITPVHFEFSEEYENLTKMAKKMDNTTQKLIIEHNSVAHTENFMEVKLTDETNKKFSPSEIVELKIKFDGKNLIA